MSQALHKANPMVEEHTNMIDVITNGGKEYMAIVEYVPGTVLQGLEGHAVLTREGAGAILQGVGRLIALDCLTNNLDRVPAIWANDGNLGNIMVHISGDVLGIDQQVVPIADKDGRNRYFETLRDFVRDTKQRHVHGSAKPATQIKTAFLENCGVQLTDDQCKEIFAGAYSIFIRAAQLHATTLKEDLKTIDAR